MFKKLIIVLSLCTLSLSYKASDFKPFILKPSPPSGYHNINTGEQTQGQILCIGDINGDQYNDYIAASSQEPLKLYLYFWNEDKSQFVLEKLSLEKYVNVIEKIEEVMLSDLSEDGSGEIIITYSKVISNDKKYYTLVYKIVECRYSGCTYEQYVLLEAGLTEMTAPPTLIKIDGSSNSFLTFQSNQRYIVQKKQSNIYTKKSFSQFVNTKPAITSFNKVDKHFTSNIDFDGDCHSDLVLLSLNENGKHVLQFYPKQTNSKFGANISLLMPKFVQFFTFIDFDSSGTVDIVLVMGELGQQSLHIIYNINKEPKQICEPFSSFPFDVKDIQPLQLSHKLSGNSVLHFGDIDCDSFPDLLTLVQINGFHRAGLYKNVQVEGVRQLKPVQDLNANLIFEIKNPKQAAFFDLGEDGKIDIMILVEEVKGSNVSVVTRSCFVNNVKDDTLFIKILPLSQASSYEAGSNKLSNAFGITIQWRITKLDGNKKIELLNQKSQWNFGTLQLPFASGGLGRTNNYVEDLTIGYQGMGQKMSWSPIIPNSKLLMYSKDGEWKLETLLTNSERVNQVIYVSVVILLVLGIVIFLLNYRQNQQDKKDQYNFIQLIR